MDTKQKYDASATPEGAIQEQVDKVLKEGSKPCDCIKRSTAQVIEHLTKRNEGKAVISDGEYTNLAINFGKGPAQLSYDEFGYESARIKKDGTTSRPVRKVISVYHCYCPHCGQKIPTA